MRLSRKLAIAALAVVALGAHEAQAGLNGSYYYLGYGAGSVTNALSDIASLSPTATFNANTVCFPSCGASIGDGSTLAQFLDGNASDISANSITNLSGHVVVLTGDLNIGTAGSYSFALGSDDGSTMWIDGNVVVDNDGDHGFNYQTQSISLSAGEHAIEIVQYENGGGTGLTVLENGVGLGGSNISTSTSAPEPASIALLGIGLLGLGLIRRARA